MIPTKAELYGKRRQIKAAITHARMQGFLTRTLFKELQAVEARIADLRRTGAWSKPIYNGWSNLGPATRKRFYKQGEF